jgi:hypothetical protein
MQTTFTKFDQLGACLSELSFDCIGLNMSRDPDGTINHWTVYLHFNERCVQGIGDTPSGALGKAFAKQFEDAAERAAA